MNLIPPQEAEKAAEQHAESRFVDHQQDAYNGYVEAITHANTVYDEKIKPVLERCKTSLSLFKVHETKDRIPHCFITGNFDGKKSDYVLGWDADGQIHVVCCYHGFMDGSEFTDFYNVDDFEIKIVRWMNQPDLWELASCESTLSELNELLTDKI